MLVFYKNCLELVVRRLDLSQTSSVTMVLIFTHMDSLYKLQLCYAETSPINIGENAFIGPGTCLSCAGHPIYPSERIVEGISTSKPITIENDVWIGANCTVFGGVTIGAGTVIGGGSVVTKDIPAGVVAAGKPMLLYVDYSGDNKN